MDGAVHHLQFYIDGAWVSPTVPNPFDVVDPSSEEVFTQVSLGSAADVDLAVEAARRAFPAFSRTRVAERRELLRRIVEAYKRRQAELAAIVSLEMGAPRELSRDEQVASGLAHLSAMVEVLETYEFDTYTGTSVVAREPIGVAGLITPWNWPLNQIACKVAPALGAGCTVVLKPSEVAPLSAIIFAEILDEAGTPPGVFNLVNGDGPTVGQALSAHPDVDMISFTGSTAAGIKVARAAADTVKRVSQELGGKSANILLPDVDLPEAVTRGVAACFSNSGQSCNAPTRMFVHRPLQEGAVAYARAAAETFIVGHPEAPGTMLGPVVSQLQFDRIQTLIAAGIAEGATLVCGGLGKPNGLNRGHYVRPTIFSDVTPDMRIAREEIFGPVLAILPYDTVEEAIEMANDTPFGLAAYVQTKNLAEGRAVARRMRAGTVRINRPAWDPFMPFGGYKQSGNGREYGAYGLEDFMEIKAITGYGAA